MNESQSAVLALPTEPGNYIRRWRVIRTTAPYVFVAPFFIIFFTFFAYPVVYSFYISLHKFSGQGPMKWVGWDNYSFALSDNYFTGALENTAFFWMSVPITVLLALIIAVIWNRPGMIGRSVLLVMFLLPTVISIVAISVVFRILYDPTAGPIDTALSWFGLAPVDWLNDDTSARFGLLILRVWETLGLGILFIASSLQAISQDLYDAAAVDGSGPVRTFVSLTVPLLARTILFLMVWYTLSALSLFAEPFLVMNQGGPDNATVTLGLYLFQRDIALDLGTASAVSFLTTCLMMFMSILLFLAARRWTRD
ncbi:MAG TPA: sugar ABC transporter permease [Chloroflexota bacterium]|nr:sugar ABC transporter permease [Chloroflexota bacterium]